MLNIKKQDQQNQIIKLINVIKSILIIILPILQIGCSTTKNYKNSVKEDTFEFKKQEMDDALKMCWDVVRSSEDYYEEDDDEDEDTENDDTRINSIKLKQEQSISKEFWRNYYQKKINSKELWNDYSKKVFTSFWNDKTNKYINYAMAFFSFGITLIPTEYKENYDENDHPSYQDTITYCDFKFDEYKKQYGELNEKERIIADSQEWLKNNSKKLQEEKQHITKENKKQEAKELKRKEIAQKNHELEAQKKNNYAKSLGYDNGISDGIISMVGKITSGKSNLQSATKLLIRKTSNDNFKVSNIIDEYVIFQTFRNYDLVQIAVIKEPNEIYIDQSILKGKYFAIIGRQQFTKVFGGNSEILVLKRIE